MIYRSSCCEIYLNLHSTTSSDSQILSLLNIGIQPIGSSKLPKEIRMSMSISPVVSSNAGRFDPSKIASVVASKMMKDLDPNNIGTVSKDQFISGMAAKGMSSADATAMYDAIDAKKAGSIGKSDIEAAIKSGNLKPPPGGPQGGPRGPGGPGKNGGGGPDGPGGAGKSSSSNSSSTAYAAADTNQDGVVSVQEAAVYAVKHPSVSTTDSTKTDLSKLGKSVDEMV
jgi:hypothetical protein